MSKQIAIIAAGAASLATAVAAAAPPSTLTLAANPLLVTYGKTTALTGHLAPAKAKQNITLQAQECGKTTFVKVDTVKTNASSAYSLSVTPAVATTYRATFRATTSPTVAVTVRPLVQLTRVARGSYTAKITAGQALTGKAVLFQRYSRLRKRWVQVKRVVLTTATPAATKPTVVTSAAFHAKAPRRARVRLLFSVTQAAPCYLSAKSNVLRA
jgi:hypothetical protein